MPPPAPPEMQAVPSSISKMPVIPASQYFVISDFDGTICDEDIAYRIIQEFSTGDWQALEDQYLAGTLSSRDELAAQFALVDATEADILEWVRANAVFDPAFEIFYNMCQTRGIDVDIVSEGLIFYIEFLLSLYLSIDAAKINVLANSQIFTDSGILVDYFSVGEECEICGNCKLAHLRELQDSGKKVIYIGDGGSDFCASEHADIIFAKSKLASYLDSKGINYFKYENFNDIIRTLEDMI